MASFAADEVVLAAGVAAPDLAATVGCRPADPHARRPARPFAPAWRRQAAQRAGARRTAAHAPDRRGPHRRRLRLRRRRARRRSGRHCPRAVRRGAGDAESAAIAWSSISTRIGYRPTPIRRLSDHRQRRRRRRPLCRRHAFRHHARAGGRAVRAQEISRAAAIRCLRPTACRASLGSCRVSSRAACEIRRSAASSPLRSPAAAIPTSACRPAARRSAGLGRPAAQGIASAGMAAVVEQRRMAGDHPVVDVASVDLERRACLAMRERGGHRHRAEQRVPLRQEFLPGDDRPVALLQRREIVARPGGSSSAPSGCAAPTIMPISSPAAASSAWKSSSGSRASSTTAPAPAQRPRQVFDRRHGSRRPPESLEMSAA